MNVPQAVTQVPFVRNWIIRRPYVYRYMDKKYVDRFFEDGSLRLSSFAEFSRHADEQRQDKEEGKGNLWHMNSEGEGQTIVARMGMGQNAYVLCGSRLHDQAVARDFKCDSGFRINDTTAFANMIASHIPGFQGGCEGACLYLSERSVDRDLGRVDFDMFRDHPGDKTMNLNKIQTFLFNSAGTDLFFLKLKKFVNQNEYRFLWLTSSNVDGILEIKCPEARQFCTRFEELRTESQTMKA
ncbi:MAG: hypothetical protein PHO79_04020 [Desulfoplanes sp.]|nr:hypothetical protein [Desulfoplanes sp.]